MKLKKVFLNREWDRVDEYGNRHRVTVRQALQELGTELFRKEFHENTWLNALFADYKPIGMTDGWIPTYNDPDNSGLNPTAEPIYPKWIITDIRYPNEANRVLEHRGILIRVHSLKTSEEWIKEINSKKEILKVLDPDGWDRTNMDHSWFEEKISIYEFYKKGSKKYNTT
jgi:hypothetical protein